MRWGLLAVAAMTLACSGGAGETSDSSTGGSSTAIGGSSSGGEAGEPATGGGESSGGANSDTGGSASGGDAPTTGGASSGGAGTGGDAQPSGGAGGTGGASGGTAGSTGGASGGTATGGVSSGGSGGGTQEPDPCKPPALRAYPAPDVGDDVNNVCGWTTATAPTSYARSASQAVDCADPVGLVVELSDSVGGLWENVVSVIGADDTCSPPPMLNADRIYKIAAGYCTVLRAPFAGFSAKVNNVNSVSNGCLVVSAPAGQSAKEIEINLSEDGWVHANTAKLVGGNCPLSCP